MVGITSTASNARLGLFHTLWKYPYIDGYFAANFPNFYDPVPYTFVSVSRRNNDGLHYSVDLRIQTYTELVALNYGRLATKYPWKYGYFYSVAWSVYLYVCSSHEWSPLLNVLYGDHALENGWTDGDTVWRADSCEPKWRCIGWGICGRHLANTIERSVLGGDLGCH